MGFWLTEKHTDGYSVNWKFTETLYIDQTEYQRLAIINSQEFGKALVLDGNIQTTEKEEFVYHEMIVHPAMMSHPNPQKVLVIGGGDGGTVREAVRYKSVRQADLVEIDEKVIWASRKFLPDISCSLSDKRVRIFVEDGLQFVKNKKDYYDVIFVDSSDPVGPAVELFGKAFYTDIYNALKEDGIVVAQTDSPLFNPKTFSAANKKLKGLFPIVRPCLAPVATYMGGFWSFTIGSKKYDPCEVTPSPELLKRFKLKYYNEDVHKGCFALPNFIKKLAGK